LTSTGDECDFTSPFNTLGNCRFSGGRIAFALLDGNPDGNDGDKCGNSLPRAILFQMGTDRA
jgi:hypothetical protein